ncbi:MAG: hypothetical protein M5U19_23440 [Microthrixaceae bacterium]|nr:hypothetical protein [Microthrixaceae bacterium]
MRCPPTCSAPWWRPHRGPDQRAQARSEGLDGIDTQSFERDVTSEAFNLCAAMVDADGRHTDNELNALIDTFGPLMDDTRLLLATPDDLRGTSLVAGARDWIESDSELFKVLLAADEARDTDLAEVYYRRTMEVAHVIASLDVVTARDELTAIATLRTRLLAGLRQRREDGRSLTPTTPRHRLRGPANHLARG